MKWSNERILAFYDSFKDHADNESSRDFNKVAEVIGGGITADDCEEMWRAHQTFLSLPRAPSLSIAFAAMVQDTFKNLAAVAEDDEDEDEAMEADDEGTYSQPKSKRTPKPSAKFLSAASPSKSKPSASRLGNGGPSPPSSVKRSRAAALSALGPFHPGPSGGGDETGSAKRKRQRKLFSSTQDPDNDDNPDPDALAPHQPGSASKRHSRDRKPAVRGGSHDDVGEGVDALLHLASVADHATEGSIDQRGDSSVVNASGRPSTTPPVDGDRIRGGGHKEGTVEGSMPPPPLPHPLNAVTMSQKKPPRGQVIPLGSSLTTPTHAKVPASKVGSGTGGGLGSRSTRGTTGSKGRRRPSKYDEDPDEEEDEGLDEEGTESDEFLEGRKARGKGGRAKPSSRRKSGGGGGGRSERVSSRSASLELNESGGGTGGGSRATKGGGSGRSAQPRKSRTAPQPHGGSSALPTGFIDSNEGLPFPLEGLEHLLPMHPNNGGGGLFGYEHLLNPSLTLGYGMGQNGSVLGQMMMEGGAEVRVRRKVMPHKGGSPGMTLQIKSLLPSIGAFKATGGTGQGGGAGGLAADATHGHVLVEGGGTRHGQGGPSIIMGSPADPQASCIFQRNANEAALRRCLSVAKCRRWVASEFVYSAIDRPWFLRNELAELLQFLMATGQIRPSGSSATMTSDASAGLGAGAGAELASSSSSATPPITLTRTQWSILRSSFGRPRRLSLHFLKEERVKLEAYREHVRQTHADHVANGAPVPPELPRPLKVGQGVVARHPMTQELHDGTVLTTTGSSYRVQFSRSDLLTEVVRDVDLMPLDPFECLPLTLPIPPTLLNGRAPPPPTAEGAEPSSSSSTLMMSHPHRSQVRAIPRGAPSDMGGALGPPVHSTPNNPGSHLVHTLGMMPTPGGMGMGGLGAQGGVFGGSHHPHPHPVMRQPGGVQPMGGMMMSHPSLIHPGPPPTGKGFNLTGDEDQIVAHLSKLLGEKDALLLRIKAMNDERESQGEGQGDQDQGQFQKDYSQAILGLRDVNTNIENALSLASKRKAEASSLLAQAGINQAPGTHPTLQDPLLTLMDYSRTGMEHQRRVEGLVGSSPLAAIPPGSAMITSLEDNNPLRAEGGEDQHGHQAQNAPQSYHALASAFSQARSMVDKHLAHMQGEESKWEPSQGARSMITGCLTLMHGIEMYAADPSLQSNQAIEAASRLLMHTGEEGGQGAPEGVDPASLLAIQDAIQTIKDAVSTA